MRPYDLSEDGFLETVRRLNGTPPKVLDHPELMKLMLPVLRADFQMAQNYKYLTERPLNCPLTVFGGLRDEEVCSDCLRAWRQETIGEFSLRMIDGDHFFIQRARPLLLQMLSHQLQELTTKLSGL
jgi:medium-chain acyl-[acyl-carrier-protein] hydrolase